MVGACDQLERRTQALRDRVALLAAVVLVDEVDLQIALLGVGAQVVLTHQPVEGDRACGPGIALQVAHLRLLRKKADRISCSVAAVSSSGVPAGISTTTWNSLLLSNGSIFSTTHLHGGEPHRQQQRADDAGQQQPAFLRPARSQNGIKQRWNKRCSRAPSRPAVAAAA